MRSQVLTNVSLKHFAHQAVDSAADGGNLLQNLTALTLQRNALLGKVKGRYDALLEALGAQGLPEEGTLWLHERLGRFPGLAAHLAEGLGHPLEPLAEACLWTGLEAQGPALRGTVGALSYLTTLAVPAYRPPPESAPLR